MGVCDGIVIDNEQRTEKEYKERCQYGALV